MYDAKGIILKQKQKMSMAYDHHNSNISRFKYIFAKEQFLNYLKTNLGYLVCHVQKKNHSLTLILYSPFLQHTYNNENRKLYQ